MKKFLVIPSGIGILIGLIWLGESFYNSGINISSGDTIKIVEVGNNSSVKSSNALPALVKPGSSPDELALNLAFSSKFRNLPIAKTTCSATECTIELATVSSKDKGANDEVLRLISIGNDLLLKGTGFVVHDREFILFGNGDAYLSLKVSKADAEAPLYSN